MKIIIKGCMLLVIKCLAVALVVLLWCALAWIGR
jgi:hypothetical protein